MNIVFIKLTFSLFLTLLFLNSALALDSSPQIPSDNTSVLSVKPETCSFSGSFSQQKEINGIDQALESNGVFFYDCQIGIIWQTLSPIQEALVLQKVGKSYIVTDDDKKIMKSPQSKVISKLIMALVGGNDDYLADQFSISKTLNSIFLTPKNKRLKRAINEIIITYDSSHGLSQTDQLTVTMTDRNNQETRIDSKKVSFFEDTDKLTTKIQNCINSSYINTSICELLINL